MFYNLLIYDGYSTPYLLCYIYIYRCKSTSVRVPGSNHHVTILRDEVAAAATTIIMYTVLTIIIYYMEMNHGYIIYVATMVVGKRPEWKKKPVATANRINVDWNVPRGGRMINTSIIILYYTLFGYNILSVNECNLMYKYTHARTSQSRRFVLGT